MSGSAWTHITLRCSIYGEVVYAHSQLDARITEEDFAGPTDEERARGYAEREIRLTAEQAWEWGTCLDCDLPLPLHPDARRKRSKPRYCREAARAASRPE